jgi:hypothetical protein
VSGIHIRSSRKLSLFRSISAVFQQHYAGTGRKHMRNMEAVLSLYQKPSTSNSFLISKSRWNINIFCRRTIGIPLYRSGTNWKLQCILEKTNPQQLTQAIAPQDTNPFWAKPIHIYFQIGFLTISLPYNFSRFSKNSLGISIPQTIYHRILSRVFTDFSLTNASSSEFYVIFSGLSSRIKNPIVWLVSRLRDFIKISYPSIFWIFHHRILVGYCGFGMKKNNRTQ